MAKATLSTPRIDVSLKSKPNGSASQAQYVPHDNPPPPTAGLIDDIPQWQKKIVSLAEDLRADLINSGVEPGGLIYMVWDKGGGFKIKILPTEMKVASAANILRGIALQMEQTAVQSVTVGTLTEESKLNG